MIRTWLFPALVASAAVSRVHLATTPPAEISGIVFDDRNANGTRDPGEPGLAGVPVSNQDTVVVTDASGAFRMTAAGTGVIFVSVPDGRRSVGAFWRNAATA